MDQKALWQEEAMRTISFMILTALIAFQSGSAFAQGRPNSTAMTCAQAAGLVKARGAVVMSTGPMTYDRYVSSRGFCSQTEITVPDWVATRDSNACFVGYRCREVTRSFRG
jgi:hypothetical protein